MRNRLFAIVMIGMMSVVALIGCGKTAEEKAAEDLGITLEEYQELKDFVSDDEDNYNDDAEVVEVEEEKEETVLTYEASDEIKNAKFTDMQFQVDNQVVTITYGLSLNEFMNQLTDAYFSADANREEISMDKLVAPGNVEQIYIYNKNQPENANWCLCLAAQNNSESESMNLSDCSLIDMDLNKTYAGSVYFAKGIPFDGDALASDANYSFENLPTLLTTFDLEDFENHDFEERTGNCGRQYVDNVNGGLMYEIHAYAPEDIKYWNGNTWGEQKLIARPNYSIIFKIDENTRTCSQIDFCFNRESNWE